jgi:hypothetical protein
MAGTIPVDETNDPRVSRTVERTERCSEFRACAAPLLRMHVADRGSR